MHRLPTACIMRRGFTEYDRLEPWAKEGQGTTAKEIRMETTTTPQVAALRQELPVGERLVYLNTGTAGPLPRRSAAAITAANERQLMDGRASFKVYMEEYFPLLDDVRAGFARLLG